MKNKTLLAIALVGLLPFTALASDNAKSDVVRDNYTKSDVIKDRHSKSDVTKNKHAKSDVVKGKHAKSDTTKRKYHKRDNAKEKNAKKNHSDIEMMDIEFTLFKNGEKLTNTKTAFPLIFNNKKYGKNKRDSVVYTKVGKFYFSKNIEDSLRKKEKDKESFSVKVSHNKDFNEFVFDISEKEKPMYQTSIPYKKGQKVVKTLGEHKLVVQF